MCDKDSFVITEWSNFGMDVELVVIPFTNCSDIITIDKEPVLFRTLRLQKSNKKEARSDEDISHNGKILSKTSANDLINPNSDPNEK